MDINQPKSKKLAKWDKNIIQLSLDDEIYPNDNFPDTFFLVNKKEIDKLVENTKKRINYYNKNIKPRSWAGYSKYPSKKQ